MTTQVIVDPKGKFYVNTGSFPFVDPTQGQRFEPGVHVQIVQTAWMKEQPVIKEVAQDTKASK